MRLARRRVPGAASSPPAATRRRRWDPSRAGTAGDPTGTRSLAALVGTAIERHSRLEDEILFGVLARQSTEAEGIVRSMQRMHEDIRDTLAQIRALPNGPTPGTWP